MKGGGRTVFRPWMAGLFIMLIALAVGVWPQAEPAGELSPDAVVEIRYVGVACGSHLTWHADLPSVNPGTTILFVNNSPFWTIPIKIAANENLKAPAVAESVPLPPGTGWLYQFQAEGEYFLTSGDMMQRQAGLAGWLTVKAG